MAKQTEADKKSFATWLLGLMKSNKDTIANEGKKGVKFDTDGLIVLME